MPPEPPLPPKRAPRLMIGRAELALMGATLLWGASFLIVHHAVRESGPFFFVGLRFATAALVTLPLEWWFKRRGLLGLAFWHNGMKQMSAKAPLLTPADAAGMKFRVQNSEVLKAQMAALGGSPQPMAFSEVYGALQTGVVDGQENTWSNIYGQKFFEVQDGTTETNHGIIDYLLVTSTDWLDSLDADMRDQFLAIVAEVTEARNSESTAVNESAKQEIIKAGGVVRSLTAEQRAAWVEAMKPVWDQFAGDVGEDNIAAAQAINANN